MWFIFSYFCHRLMALTPAEMQRRYRERRNADEARRQANLKKDRERWQKNKIVVADMSERQHRWIKRKWTTDNRRQRRLNLQLSQIIDDQLSPPGTPGSMPHGSGWAEQAYFQQLSTWVAVHIAIWYSSYDSSYLLCKLNNSFHALF